MVKGRFEKERLDPLRRRWQVKCSLIKTLARKQNDEIRRISLRLVGIGLWWGITVVVHATSPSLNLSHMVVGSDLIIVGTPQEITETDRGPGEYVQYRATLKIQKVLKGVPHTKSVVLKFSRHPRSTLVYPVEAQSGIFLMQWNAKDKRYDLYQNNLAGRAYRPSIDWPELFALFDKSEDFHAKPQDDNGRPYISPGVEEQVQRTGKVDVIVMFRDNQARDLILKELGADFEIGRVFETIKGCSGRLNRVGFDKLRQERGVTHINMDGLSSPQVNR